VAKETNHFGVKRRHPFGVNLNLVLFIPQERVFLPTVKSFWGKKKQIYFYPKSLPLCAPSRLAYFPHSLDPFLPLNWPPKKKKKL